MTAPDDKTISAPPLGILIVGGYGSVGRHIAGLLADELAERLLIGGRDATRATRIASKFGGRARVLDIDDSESYGAALQDVALVIMCLDTTTVAFPQACVARGIDYLDISASYEVIERLGLMGDLARAHDASIVCSVGLAPGLTNLLAKACVRAADHSVTNVDIHLLFGLGDRHGKAALEWMVDRLHRSFEIKSSEGARLVRPFEEQSLAQFPPPFGARATYRFDLSDQHTLPRTQRVSRVSTWCCFDSERLSRWVSQLAGLGVLRWNRFRPVRRLSVASLRTMRSGSEQFAIAVEAKSAEHKIVIRRTATGFGEARATALMAAETARRMLAESLEAGVFQLDELYHLADFAPTLIANGIELDGN